LRRKQKKTVPDLEKSVEHRETDRGGCKKHCDMIEIHVSGYFGLSDNEMKKMILSWDTVSINISSL